jgi:hypothetical protein
MENQIRSRDVKLVPIGNSKGIRIPKALLQKYGLKNSLLIEETDKGLLLRNKEVNLSGKSGRRIIFFISMRCCFFCSALIFLLPCNCRTALLMQPSRMMSTYCGLSRFLTKGVSARRNLSVLFKDIVPLRLRLLRFKSRKNRSRIYWCVGVG